MDYKEKIASLLLYGGIGKEEYQRVKAPVAESNHRALLHWSVLSCVFWLYCMAMSLKAGDYALCRPAYTVALSAGIVTYLLARFLVPRFPKALEPCMCLLRLSFLGGGIGIAMCQWDVRSLTLFAAAIVLPSIFIDNTISSLITHAIALIGYIALARNVIVPDIYSWGLGNYILFSIFGLLIGNAINKERFERFVFADSAKKLADLQTKFAYFDQMTGLKNRRAYAEKLLQLDTDAPSACCVVMIDINGLKHMNDTCGHTAGDELIVGTAECLRASFPDTEDIYRLGGDEFCVIVEDNAENVQKSLVALEQNAAAWKGRFVSGISIAVGMASDRDAFGNASDREVAEMRTIVKEADVRMYEAKRKHYAETGSGRGKQ